MARTLKNLCVAISGGPDLRVYVLTSDGWQLHDPCQSRNHDNNLHHIPSSFRRAVGEDALAVRGALPADLAASRLVIYCISHVNTTFRIHEAGWVPRAPLLTVGLALAVGISHHQPSRCMHRGACIEVHKS